MSRTPSPSEIERRLRVCEEEYTAIKARIQEIGFICTGSLAKRWTVCGKPNCRCSRDPDQRHGPYYQLTWKEAGVTVTRRLLPEHAQLYKTWIANRRRLDNLLAQMQRVSSRAGRQLLRAAKEDSAQQPTRGRTSKSQ